jgi:hypothetical protein
MKNRTLLRKVSIVSFVFVFLLGLSGYSQTPILSHLSSIDLGSFDEGAAEIVDYDPATFQLFVTNAEEYGFS